MIALRPLTLLSILRGGIVRAARDVRHRRVSRDVHAMPDRILADIGIPRCGIEHAVRRGRDER